MSTEVKHTPDYVTNIVYRVWTKKDGPSTAIEKNYNFSGLIVGLDDELEAVLSIESAPSGIKMCYKIIGTTIYKKHSYGTY